MASGRSSDMCFTPQIIQMRKKLGDKQLRICVTRGVKMHTAINICFETQIEIYIDPFGAQV